MWCGEGKILREEEKGRKGIYRGYEGKGRVGCIREGG